MLELMIRCLGPANNEDVDDEREERHCQWFFVPLEKFTELKQLLQTEELNLPLYDDPAVIGCGWNGETCIYQVNRNDSNLFNVFYAD